MDACETLMNDLCCCLVAIEIPLFHVMNACVTFGNIFAMDEAVHGISTIQEVDRLSCAIDESCFQVPSDYSKYGRSPSHHSHHSCYSYH